MKLGSIPILLTILASMTLAQPPAPFTLGTGGPGLSALDSAANPPDVAGAIGPEVYVAAVNYQFAIYDRQLKKLASISGRDFFQDGGQHIDARVIWHKTAKCFWITAMTPKGIVFAQSKTDNPRSFALTDWSIYGMGNGASDYPIFTQHPKGLLGFASKPFGKLIRVTHDGVIDTVDMPKELQAGGVPSPAVIGNTLWLVRGKDSNRNKLRMFKVDDPFGTITVTAYDVPTTQFYLGNSARQPGGIIQNTGQPTSEAMIEDVDGKNHFVVALGGFGNKEQEPRVYWFDVDISNVPTMHQQGVIDPGAGTDCYSPAIAINSSGDIGLTYCQSSATEFVSIYVTGRRKADPLGTMQPPKMVKASTTKLAYFYRFGDYASMTVDPRDGTFWAANEWVDNGKWATWIQPLGFTAVSEPWQPFTGTITINGFQYDIKGETKKK